MRMVNTRLPNTSNDDWKWKKQKMASTILDNKLDSIKKLIEAYPEKAITITIPKELRLTDNDCEELIRRFKTFKFPVENGRINYEKLLVGLQEQEYFSTFFVWYHILASKASPSTVYEHKMNEHTRYSVATSFLMLAAREAYDIPYSAWYTENKDYLGLLFHKGFAEALVKSMPIYDVIVLSPEEIDDISPASPAGWKFAVLSKEMPPEFAKLPQYIKHMKLGTWIFHGSVADENSMIFSPTNWDYVPKFERATSKPKLFFSEYKL